MNVDLDLSEPSPHTAVDPARQVLAFGDRAATQWDDPDVFGEQLSQAIPLRDLGAIGQRTEFRNRCTTVHAGDIPILSGSHTSLYGSADESDRATVLLTLAGEAHYWIKRQCLEAKGHLTTLFLPGASYRAQTDHFNGVIFTVSPEQVFTAGAVMAGLECPTAEMQAEIASAQQFRIDSAPNATPILGLRHALDLFDLPGQLPQDLAASLGVEDILHRCIALMLFPHLSDNDRSATGAAISENRLRAIEDFLMANLDGRPSLTQVEQHFGVSRRTLQHAFRSRHGCGPMQWLRRQRLRYARNRLLMAEHQDRSVATVAVECGYTNLSCFSSDFKELFAARPSDYLRY